MKASTFIPLFLSLTVIPFSASAQTSSDPASLLDRAQTDPAQISPQRAQIDAEQAQIGSQRGQVDAQQAQIDPQQGQVNAQSAQVDDQQAQLDLSQEADPESDQPNAQQVQTDAQQAQSDARSDQTETPEQDVEDIGLIAGFATQCFEDQGTPEAVSLANQATLAMAQEILQKSGSNAAFVFSINAGYGAGTPIDLDQCEQFIADWQAVSEGFEAIQEN